MRISGWSFIVVADDVDEAIVNGKMAYTESKDISDKLPEIYEIERQHQVWVSA